MLVAHVTTVGASLAILLRTELLELQKAGAEVIAISGPDGFDQEIRSLGIDYIAIPSLTRSLNPVADARACFDLYRTLRTLHPDVVHTHTPKAGVIGRFASRLAHVPVVVNTCHGLWATSDSPFMRRVTVRAIEALAAQFSDAELFQNREDLNTMRRFLRDHLVRLVGNGIDLTSFEYDLEARKRVRTELGVSDREVLVGAVGRQVREKGIAEFSAVAAALSSQGVFVWIGPSEAEMRGAVSGSADSVRFLGFRGDMPDVYSALDVFVLPSHREGFPRSAMEAAACGRAMVLTDVRGCREIGNDNRELLLVPPRSAAALTTAVRRLMLDEDLRKRLGAAARAKANESFDQRRVAEESLDCYQEVFAHKNLPWPLPPRTLH